MKYKNKRFNENLDILNLKTEGLYNIPLLQPYKYFGCEFIGFNYAKSEKVKTNKGLHFFLDDYQFERLWRSPYQYVDLLSDFKCVMTPDFSLYTDFPKAIQIYNHYRKHWLGAFWQAWGIDVIPTIAWSDKESYSWCFDGAPKGSTVAVSSVGTQKDKTTRRLFLAGFDEMLCRLNPETIIFYGDVPKECNGHIVKINSFQDKFKEVKISGW